MEDFKKDVARAAAQMANLERNLATLMRAQADAQMQGPQELPAPRSLPGRDEVGGFGELTDDLLPR